MKRKQRNPEDEPIDGGTRFLSPSTITAAQYLAETLAKDHGCLHGKTAAYWSIIGTVLSHAKVKIGDEEETA